MMKKIYFLFPIFLIYQVASAQITLTRTTSVPSTGDTYSMITFNNAITGIKQSGTNKTWDLSSVSNNGVVNYGYVPKSSVSEAANFPQSNLVDTINITQNFDIVSSSSWAVEGSAVPPLNRTVYTDKKEMIDFPITYNNTFSETFSGTYTVFFPSLTTYNRSGTIQIKADAYGTLKLPYATISNVLRVLDVTNYTDVNGAVTDTYIDTLYSWFNATTHTPIANYIISYRNGVLNFEGGAYLDQANLIIGINDYDRSNILTAYPNPANNELTLNLENINNFNNANLTIIDVQGRIVITKEISKNGQTYKVNISKLPKGIYTLKLNYNDKVITKKFVKN